MLTEEHLNEFDELEYFIADGLLAVGMFEELCAAARIIKATVRAGEIDLYTDYHGDVDPYH